MSKGRIFVISGASGTGKTTLCRSMEKDLGYFFSISATTRPQRPGENDGKDYYFLSKEKFGEMVEAGEFLEWAQVYDYRYGTPRKPIEDHIQKGNHTLLDLDTQGALQVKRIFSEAVLIFVKPPSIEELKNRLYKRGTDSQKTIEMRIKKAEQEISQNSKYDYVLVNHDLGTAIQELKGIILDTVEKG